MNLVFLGPPGAGKGTQSKMICNEYNLTQLSTGDILRENYRQGTALGKLAAKYWGGGGLVPDDIMINLMRDELSKPIPGNGYIFDGFPRTVPQADALQQIFEELNMKLDVVLVLDVDMNELVRRLSARRTCTVCGKTYHLDFNPPKQAGLCDMEGAPLYQRPDDQAEAIATRLQVFQDQTFLLEDYYIKKGLAEHIPGMNDINVVFSDIKTALDKYK